MGRSIDERIVQMQFDNARFEQNARKSMSTIDSLKQKLNFSGAAKGLDALQRSANAFDMSAVGNTIGVVQAKFSAMQVAGMTVIAELTRSVLGLFKTISANTLGLIKTGGINRAMNIEAAKFSLQGLGIAWKDAYSSIDFGVTDTAYSLDSAAKAAAQLSASGVSVYKSIEAESIDAANGNKVVTRSTTEMGKSLKAISAVAAQTNSDFDSMAQIFATVAGQGKVMSMQMQQLSSRGMNAYTVIGERLGKTEAEVREMVSKGKIDYDTFMDAMYFKFAENAGKANETLTGVTSNIRSALSKIGALFASPIVQNGGSLVKMLDAIRERLNTFKKALDASGVAEDIFGKRLNQVFDAMAKVIKGVDVEKYANNVAEAFRFIDFYAQKFVAIFKAVRIQFRSIFPKSTTKEATTFADKLKNITKYFIISDSAIRGFTRALKDTLRIVRMIGRFAKDIFLELFPSLKDLDIFKELHQLKARFNNMLSGISFEPVKLYDLYNLLDNIRKIAGIVHDAFLEFFPTEVIDRVKNLGEYLKGFIKPVDKLSSGSLEKLTTFFRGLFSVLDTIYTVFSALVSAIFPKVSEFFSKSTANFSLLDFLEKIGNALLKFNGFVHEFIETSHPFRMLISAIATALGSLWEALKKILAVGGSVFGDLFKSALALLTPVVKILKKFVDALKGVLDSLANGEKIDWKKMLGATSLVVTFAWLWKRIKWFFDKLKFLGKSMKTSVVDVFFKTFTENVKKLADFPGNVASLPTKLGNAFMGFANEKNASAMLKLALAIGVLTASMVALTTVDPGKMIVTMGAVMAMVYGLVGAMKWLMASNPIASIAGWQDALANLFNIGTQFAKMQAVGSMIIKFAAAIGILSIAVIALAKLKPEELFNGLVIVLSLIAGMVFALNKMTLSGNTMLFGAIAAAFIGFGAAIGVMAIGVRSLAKLNPTELLTGLGGVLGLMFGIGIVVQSLKGATGSFALIGIGLIGLAAGIAILVGAIAGLSYLAKDTTSFVNALGGFVTILFAVTGAIALLGLVGPIALAGAASIMIASVAMVALAGAVAVFSKIGNAASTIMKISGALIVMFAALGVAAIVSPLVLIFAGAIALLGPALFVLGKGLLVSAAGLTALSTGLVASVGVIVGGIGALVYGLGRASISLGSALAMAVLSFIEKIAEGAVAFVKLFGTMISSALMVLKEKVPEIISLGITLILSLVNAIASKVGAIINVAVQFVSNFLTGLAQNLPTIIQAGIDLMVGFIDGLANGIRDNTDKVISAVGNLVSAVIEAALSLLQYLVEDIPLVGDEMAAGLESAKGKVREVLTYDSMSSIGNDAMAGVADSIKEHAGTAEEAGEEVGNAVKTGVEKSMADSSFNIGDIGSGIRDQLTQGLGDADLTDVGINLGTTLTDGLSSTDIATPATELGESGADAAAATAPQFEGAGRNAGAGWVSGIKSYFGSAGSVGGTLGKTSLNSLKSALGIHSPSREFGKAAKFSVLGFVNNLKNFAYMASDAAAQMGKDSLSALIYTVERMVNAMDSEGGPVITPVLDMSVAESQLRQFGSDFGSTSLNLARSTNSPNQNGVIQRLNDLTDAVSQLKETQNTDALQAMYGLMQTYFPSFTKDIVLDGRKVSKGTAVYMNDNIASITRFNNLLAGVK